MAQLTLTVDDSIVPRLQAAYGAGTNQQLKTAIIDQIRKTVKDYEVALARQIENDKVRLAQDAQITAVAAAETKADSEITLT
jgi:hypothetical protein